MNKRRFLPFCLVVAAVVVGCQSQNKTQTTDNPLLMAYETPFQVPPFDKIKLTHYRPAFDEALKQHNLEIDSIVANSEEPSFSNTIVALENAGSLLSNVSSVFFNINSANTSDSIQAIAKDLAPILSAHSDEISLNKQLFDKVKAVYAKKAELSLDAEDAKLLEETYKGFVRSGANLSDADKEKLKKKSILNFLF